MRFYDEKQDVPPDIFYKHPVPLDVSLPWPLALVCEQKAIREERDRLILWARFTDPRPTWGALAAKVFPDVSPELQSTLLWSTGFPSFWPTDDGIGCCVAQLLGLKYGYGPKEL